jgi:hypothetical protein
MKAETELRKALLAQRNEQVSLIVRVRGDVTALDTQLDALGVEVLRRYRLTNSLSVRCTGGRAVKLMDQPWVERIEADAVLKAFRR